MANVPILSFNSGELSPLIDSRTDIEKYSSGCRHLENFIPRIYGAAERRPGTRYVSSQYNSDNLSVRIVPFIYSATTAYYLEFGNLYIRYLDLVYYDGLPSAYEGVAVWSANEVITTPYLEKDLFQLQFKQVGDVLWIVHPDYAPRKLTRTTADTFSLDTIVFNKGPFMLRNDLITPDVNDTALMTSDVTDVGDTGTLTIQSDYVMTVYNAPGPGNFAVGSVLLGSTSLETAVVLAVTSSTVYLITKPSGNGFTDGENIYDSTVYHNQSNGHAGYPVVASAGINFFQTGHIGALFQLVHPKGIIAITGSLEGTDTGYIGGSLGVELAEDYTFKVSGNTHGTTKLEKCDDDFSTHTPGVYNAHYVLVKTYTNANGTHKSNEPEEDWFYRINVTAHTSVTITASLTANTNTVSGKKTGSTTGIIGIPIYIKGTYSVITKGNWDATFVLERNENGAGWEPFKTYNSKIISLAGTGNFQYSGVEDADNVQYRMNVPIHASGTIYGELTSDENIQTGIVRVTAIDSPSVAEIIVITKVGSTEPTRRWSEGVWSSVQGYPTSVTFFEGRCIYGGMTKVPTQVISTYDYNAYLPRELKVWFSYVEDYENFEAGVKDADSFELVITTTNDIRWLESLESLVLGTSGDEWRIGSNRMEQPISPTNFSARQQSTYGSRDIQAIRVNDTVLFIDFVGRKVRELTYNGDKYVAPDLTALAEHITWTGITNIALQRNPDSILWCVLEDGSLVTMTYERDQKVVAWAKYPIDGLVQSVTVIPGEYEDNVFITIRRTINGANVIYIEKFAPRVFGTLIEDAFFVDCGATFEAGTATTTVTGLGHLIGETVAVLGDGVVQATKVVNGSGNITLATAAKKVQAGLAYTSKLTPLMPYTHDQFGISQGRKIRVPEMSISYVNTMDAQYGAETSVLFDTNWTNPEWTNTSAITGLFTGTVIVSVDGGFSADNSLVISSASPLPVVVRAIIPRIEITGR